MSSSITLTARGSAAPIAGWASLGLLAVGALYLGAFISPTQAALLIVGGALGVVLYHAAFGFTAAWRVFINERRGRGLRAQMIMLAVAVLLFFPLLDAGSAFGNELSGYVFPVGVAVVVGSFLFGLGMQIGGGCASGTLFTVGGGNARMVITLLGFILGSVIATHHVDWWWDLPAFEAVSVVEGLGVTGGLALSLALFATIYAGTVYFERRRHGALEQPAAAEHAGWQRFLRGPWPLIWGAVALAVLNALTLILSGRPWGITAAFALWGAKGFEAVGIEVAQWGYWQLPGNARALEASVLADATSVVNFGIILGALLAAVLAGRLAPSLRIPPRALAASIIGGLLLGYGARLAFGCNIGAYFGGIASGSLHGWVWLIFAFLGNVVGVRLRPWFFGDESRQPRQPASC
ncbi:MAG: YeeE/YedE family protein [Halorhodospira halophila]|uniref:YeeE/YedE family protein n=1 Tax=Halorhodospira TaxID=85108 RepID=UPI001EE92499|nr:MULTISPECIES: YeeE/YedE family protein [Halorhodospira]MCC3751295.1 YeeE/YedE family protein [Halorhodospira halophila]MCG5538655.1 YeeE/YedE family protein [Halorhodospira sp. 9622]